MDSQNKENEINRRRFLQNSAKFVAAGIYLGMFGMPELFGNVIIDKGTRGIPDVKLNNGLKMPLLGFGTYGLRGELCQQSVAEAIAAGYRLIDTAKVYGNEEEVGKAIKGSGIDRKQFFVTSKLWVDDAGYENAKKGFEETLRKLGLEYLDLYLIHRPRGDIKGSWKAMEEFYKAGKIKAIGISNFDPAQMADLLSYAQIKPAVNQIETHAYFQQINDYNVLKKHNVQMQAWAPFAEGRNGLFTNEVLTQIAKKYGKTTAQVSLRWHYQRGIVSIPRSSQKVHIVENLDIFDFKLDDVDLKAIEMLDLNKTQFPEWS
ncbi:aldo/keto reductase [Flavobacterium quisquiliarum]|jgi:2,5-diketo-D-gluconate reductase A|uniref:Aldo/keto reductase n=1 Tax=Flavobacterium quisquiliarum TaxID=1834436 RepID=A0ABV8W4E3_9FLAO|nr:aldo/keto reductase [Flavobacterium quisquiliarum]MBW1654589.1 aldo/keto reductase [Flavobacterium quisquiliarum]NWL01725.1 2,5-diketo-D-gluconic acid reductase [Flavobacterium collinsii]